LRAWRVAAVGYLATLVLIVVLADLGRLPLGWIRHIPYYDTGLHFLLFGVAGLVVHRALGRRWARIGPFCVPLGPTVLLVVITVEELAQRLLPTRTWELSDLLAGVLGVGLFVGGGAVVDALRARRRQAPEEAPHG